ncbi:hypothetical protein CAPTEDRAFT_213649 [Capitella teleta]|uniref:Liprin-beta-1/2 coiled-coil domain-containing protein n=1 Tax=Capitella teleta TaxID=283909 RepID=R7VK29_CAPTE|nr:hypothetical protein CAPTEDRAFT_213649 [Capitella teleta]|eukprot:ELU16425.1 hypothetical protein CAPTEDRAFT_213649 [Capitella teleta]
MAVVNGLCSPLFGRRSNSDMEVHLTLSVPESWNFADDQFPWPACLSQPELPCSEADPDSQQQTNSLVSRRSPSPSQQEAALQDKLFRLEFDKESLLLQVSVLGDQIEAQEEKIRSLEMSLSTARRHRQRPMSHLFHSFTWCIYSSLWGAAVAIVYAVCQSYKHDDSCRLCQCFVRHSLISPRFVSFDFLLLSRVFSPGFTVDGIQPRTAPNTCPHFSHYCDVKPREPPEVIGCLAFDNDY